MAGILAGEDWLIESGKARLAGDNYLPPGLGFRPHLALQTQNHDWF